MFAFVFCRLVPVGRSINVLAGDVGCVIVDFRKVSFYENIQSAGTVVQGYAFVADRFASLRVVGVETAAHSLSAFADGAQTDDGAYRRAILYARCSDDFCR